MSTKALIRLIKSHNNPRVKQHIRGVILDRAAQQCGVKRL